MPFSLESKKISLCSRMHRALCVLVSLTNPMGVATMKYIRALLAVASIFSMQSLIAEEFVDGWGPAVDSELPQLSVKDITGENRYLADIAGKKGVVLVFVRSADW